MVQDILFIAKLISSDFWNFYSGAGEKETTIRILKIYVFGCAGISGNVFSGYQDNAPPGRIG